MRMALSFPLTASIEDEYGNTLAQRAELDWLLYNKPLEYAQLVPVSYTHLAALEPTAEAGSTSMETATQTASRNARNRFFMVNSL